MKECHVFSPSPGSVCLPLMVSFSVQKPVSGSNHVCHFFFFAFVSCASVPEVPAIHRHDRAFPLNIRHVWPLSTWPCGSKRIFSLSLSLDLESLSLQSLGLGRLSVCACNYWYPFTDLEGAFAIIPLRKLSPYTVFLYSLWIPGTRRFPVLLLLQSPHKPFSLFPFVPLWWHVFKFGVSELTSSLLFGLCCYPHFLPCFLLSLVHCLAQRFLFGKELHVLLSSSIRELFLSVTPQLIRFIVPRQPF